jgi:hypothetical protein
MKAIVSSLLAATVVLALGVGQLGAQQSQERKGFWIGFGAGYGSVDVSCDGCGNQDRLGSVSGFLKLGMTLRPNLLLGGEVNAWRKKSSGITETLGNLSAAIYIYPWTNGGFFVKGGGGLASYLASGSGPDLTGTGWGLLAGIGYDLRVGRNISITPVSNFYYGDLGSLVLAGVPQKSGWKQNVIDVGVGLTFH